MKSLKLSILFIFFASNYVFSQQWSGLNTTTDPISRTGNVAIGYNGTPNGQLQFNWNFNPRKIVFFENTNDNYHFFGIGTQAGQLRYQVGDIGSSHTFYSGVTSGTEIELLSIVSTNSTTGGFIRYPNVISNKKLVFWDNNTSTGYQFLGFGVNSGYLRYQVGNYNDDHRFFSVTSDGTAELELMRIKGNGYVGIGVDPLDKFHLNNGMIRVAGTNTPVNSGTGNMRIGSNSTNYSWIQSNGSPLLLNPLSTGANNNYVAIGFTPGTAGINVPTGYNLAVKGKVICEELKVKASGYWPDYVFMPDYKLLPLDSVAAFVEKNHHLPEVPSAQEIQTNGINTGEMNQILLKKVEELTLYVIEQKAEVSEIKEHNEELKKQNELLKEQNELLLKKFEGLSK